MSKKISLKQFLMKTGKFDKVYDCIQAIRSSKATIKDKIITNPNYFFNPKTSLIKLDNEKIRKISKLYFIMNKPAGYLSQKSENEKTIYDLFDKLNLPVNHIKSLFAVGRLDKETEGLIVITNDGTISSQISSPDEEITKKYYAVLKYSINHVDMEKIQEGIEIHADGANYKTKPCKIKIAGKNEIYISISEGKKRQIRKMFQAVGNEVIYLKRISIAGLQLGNLKVGEIKQITKEEIIEKLQF